MKQWRRERRNEWLSEWDNEWMSEWVNEWMNEWMNEWVSDWMNGRLIGDAHSVAFVDTSPQREPEMLRLAQCFNQLLHARVRASICKSCRQKMDMQDCGESSVLHNKNRKKLPVSELFWEMGSAKCARECSESSISHKNWKSCQSRSSVGRWGWQNVHESVARARSHIKIVISFGLGSHGKCARDCRAGCHRKCFPVNHITMSTTSSSSSRSWEV